MGNCMVSESAVRDSTEFRERLVRIMRVDGKILEYKAPVSVKDLLLGYEEHVVVCPGAACRPLGAEHELAPGALYYLLPAAKCPDYVNGRDDNIVNGHRRTGLEDSKDSGSGNEGVLKPPNQGVSAGKTGVVRLKVFITKQQLAELLSSGLARGASMQDLLGELQARGQTTVSHNPPEDSANYMSNGGWRPALESIPEDNNTE